ncbi:MAG TPA: DUF3857 domain-containing protein [Candidatus Acidoferrum sp.]|nr:DUF3857 domain-containing protein [Candidatus Acidoferrum sp.]
MATPKSEEKPSLPFQIQLLETHIRFETNGDSRKEVHTIVKINDLAGARQFARLGFDYNRAFQQVEISLVRISHANGGTSEILPGAITDAPNPTVEKFPAYHDVRVKSVRILGLQDGDTIEYRVMTTTTNHPLAPDFWLEHTFDRSGQVLQEEYELDLPASLAPATLMVVEDQQTRSGLVSRLSNSSFGWTTHPKLPPVQAIGPALPPRIFTQAEIFLKPSAPSVSIQKKQGGEESRTSYTWHSSLGSMKSAQAAESSANPEMADVEVGLASTWWSLSHALYGALRTPDPVPNAVGDLSRQLKLGTKTDVERAERIYDFVSQKIFTVDLPIGATGFHTRLPGDILSSGYAIAEDKFALFHALSEAMNLPSAAVLIGPTKKIETLVVRPTAFNHLVIWIPIVDVWLDPSLEVAPFRSLPAAYRGNSGLYLGPVEETHDLESLVWTAIPSDLPFPAVQKVAVNAAIGEDGKLAARVKYTLRGDNELLLRLAFHQTPKERWKEVAGLLALSDGFRGTITNVMASDPIATKDPFTVEYEITQPKFVDWSKKPVRIPALLPQIALPDLPEKTAGKIELGTPLDVQTSLKLQLPEGTTVQTPAATSVARDYATFASKYDGHLNIVNVSRHVNFVMREIPADRAVDFNAFLRAVQNDQAQMLVLLPPPAASATTP